MNIYVGNLPYKVKSEDLKEIFEKYGEVESAIVITDKYSGRSKGFGFIEMPNSEEGEKAIASLNESDVDGRNIKVNVARKREN